MSTRDDEASEAHEAHAAFERTLLGSARSDGPPPGATQAAWQRFAISLSGVSALGAGLPHAAGGVASGAAAKRAGASAAAKWLLIGAIGGSSVSALLLGAPRSVPRGDERNATPVASSVPPPQAVALVAASSEPSNPLSSASSVRVERQTGAREARSASVSKPGRSHDTSELALSTVTRSSSRISGASPKSAEPPLARRAVTASAVESRLREEVSWLDAARIAGATGVTDSALRSIDEYHARFPHGELAADAEVIALDVLSEQSDRARLLVRAARFLARYPNDPHTEHVRALMLMQER
jgi:hypothetical protein